MNIEGWDQLFPAHETSDFSLTWVVRQICREKSIERAKQLVDDFSFWCHPEMHRTHQVFWTENHWLGYCSGNLLLLELLELDHAEVMERISIFLKFKVDHGMSEFLSPVYLPYSISSLLNLFDFTKHEEIKEMSKTLIDRTTKLLLTFTLEDGSFFSPAGRIYPSYRRNLHHQHIHEIIQFVLNPDAVYSDRNSQRLLYKCLSSTTYSPPRDCLDNYNSKSFALDFRLTAQLSDVLDFGIAHPEEKILMLWMHGAYALPETILDSIMFIEENNLWKHPHFASLKPLRMLCCYSVKFLSSCVRFVLNRSFFNPYSKFSLLTAASVHVFKEGNLILSSLKGFNENCPAAQQWPWTLNLSGIAVYSIFGRNAACYGDMSRHRNAGKMPHIEHSGRVIRLQYEKDSRILQRRVLLHWNTDAFDCHGFDCLLWAVKSNAFVACHQKRLSMSIYVCNLDITSHSIETAIQEAKKILLNGEECIDNLSIQNH